MTFVLGRQDSNLGYAVQSRVPYRLATPQCLADSDGAVLIRTVLSAYRSSVSIDSAKSPENALESRFAAAPKIQSQAFDSCYETPTSSRTGDIHGNRRAGR